VQVLCQALQVSRAGFYAWAHRPPAPRQRGDRRLAVEIAAIYAESRRCYGSPRVHAELQARGHRTSRKRVARLMRAQGLAARRRRPYRVTTDSRHTEPVAPNRLARQFAPGDAHRGWVTDITFIATGEGWLYLAVILDLYSRRVLGWALGDRLTTAVALEALHMALLRRRPRPGLLHHSDRGIQYVSTGYQGVLARHGIQVSMSRRGNCWDNAVAESFFATLKVELIHTTTWRTRAQTQRAIAEYIEFFYNARRRHSALGYLSPIDFERRRARAS